MARPRLTRAELLALPIIASTFCAASAKAANAISNMAPAPAERAAMAAKARQYMQKYDVPALSVAIGTAGSLVYQEAFGLANRSEGVSATPAHLFRIASISKPITSATIFRLIDQGSLRLTDRVFGPGAILGTDFGAPPYPQYVQEITLEHLLTHTCGGWRNDGTDPMLHADPSMSQHDIIAWTIRNLPIIYPPGTHYTYSNVDYCIVGRIIEKLTGRPYADAVRQAILEPSGIDDMHIAGNTLAQRRPNEVVYYGQGGEDPYKLDVARMDSHGGWLATPSDLVAFMMRVGGFTPPTNVLTAESERTMTTPTAASGNYAKGWFVNGMPNWWHDGGLPGTTTFAARMSSGFFWAGFINTGRDASRIDQDLEDLLWEMAHSVSAWKL